MGKVVSVGVLVLTLMVVAYSARAEVKALWLFDEGQGTTAIDSSGNGCDGEINGATYVQGKYGTGLRFDGASFVDLGFPAALQDEIVGPFTVETWIKLDAAPPADHSTIIFMQASGTVSIGFTSSTGGGFYGYAGDNVKITDPDPFPVDEWVHVAHTFDGTTQKLYRNGQEIASQDASDANFDHPTDSPWTIGAWSTHDQYFLENATLDEIRVSDEALPAGELGFFGSVTLVEPQGKLPVSWGRMKSR
jgi:hypothetical protein